MSIQIDRGHIQSYPAQKQSIVQTAREQRSLLKEARSMGKIATTLLKALRRERSSKAFEASIPNKALDDVLTAMQPSATSRCEASGGNCRSTADARSRARGRQSGAWTVDQRVASADGAGRQILLSAVRSLPQGK